jgi:hypothetical protein
MSYDWKVPYDYPYGYFDSNEHGFGALERGLENLAGQAVDWMFGDMQYPRGWPSRTLKSEMHGDRGQPG